MVGATSLKLVWLVFDLVGDDEKEFDEGRWEVAIMIVRYEGV